MDGWEVIMLMHVYRNGRLKFSVTVSNALVDKCAHF
jgi:hypothetical protein